jgi:DNA polymerase-3 subunit epsilon
MGFIKGLNDIENNIKLQKYEGKDLVVNKPKNLSPLDASSSRMRICFLDLETTGLDKKEDKIIEIAIKCIEITKVNGQDITVIDSYESLQDPCCSIPESSTQINGITDEMVKGQSIDWNYVENIFNKSQLIVAHNAQFDRAFMDLVLPVSKNKIWACSINDIDWDKRNFTSYKQELLCIWHGFYYDSHRAMIDIDALIHLLTHSSYIDNKPIVELIQNAKKPVCRVDATFAKFKYKNLLKKRKYKWYSSDSGNRNDNVWYKLIQHSDIESEREWLIQNIYNGNFQGRFIEVTVIDKYKN